MHDHACAMPRRSIILTGRRGDISKRKNASRVLLLILSSCIVIQFLVIVLQQLILSKTVSANDAASKKEAFLIPEYKHIAKSVEKNSSKQLVEEATPKKHGGDADDYPVRNHGHGALPAGLMVHGKRARYSQVPTKFRKKFYATGKGSVTISTIFENAGWTKTRHLETAQFYLTQKNYKEVLHLKPWQRYSRVSGTHSWERKDRFLSGFLDYKEKNPEHSLYFLPETYRLKYKSDRQSFSLRLQNGGTNEAWVLKKVNVNNGEGIEILAPNSMALNTSISRTVSDDDCDYIVQSYVCNELTWHNGAKFDLRFFWLVASIDPPIVMYHDGYVRVGAASYKESDFSDTSKHLTNHRYRAEDIQKEGKVLAKHLYQRIRQYYKENKSRLSELISIDPVQHVINQMKESVATLFAAHIDNFPSNRERLKGRENAFGLFGIDFIIDNNLNVFLIEAQSSPGIGKYQYHKEVYRELFGPLPHLIEEIQIKQEKSPQENILPLTELGGYEIVYVGNTGKAGSGNWQYKYDGKHDITVKKACATKKEEEKNPL